MAYAASVTYTPQGPDGHVIVTVVETGVTVATHEFSFEVPFPSGSVHLQKVILTAGDGSATTVDPVLYEKTGAGSIDKVYENGGAAVAVRNVPANTHYLTLTGKLYGVSNANGTTGTTGYITSYYIVCPHFDI